jgi:hypothetical protein
MADPALFGGVLRERGGWKGPTNSDQGLNMRSTEVHFFFLDELTALGGCDSFFDGSKEAGFVIQLSNKNILRQPLRVDPGFSCDLHESLLLVGGELDFHCLQGTEKS